MSCLSLTDDLHQLKHISSYKYAIVNRTHALRLKIILETNDRVLYYCILRKLTL